MRSLHSPSKEQKRYGLKTRCLRSHIFVDRVLVHVKASSHDRNPILGYLEAFLQKDRLFSLSLLLRSTHAHGPLGGSTGSSKKSRGSSSCGSTRKANGSSLDGVLGASRKLRGSCCIRGFGESKKARGSFRLSSKNLEIGRVLPYINAPVSLSKKEASPLAGLFFSGNFPYWIFADPFPLFHASRQKMAQGGQIAVAGAFAANNAPRSGLSEQFLFLL